MQGESPTGKVLEAEVGKCEEAFNSNAGMGEGKSSLVNFPPAVIPGCVNISSVNWNNGSTVCEDDK